MNQTADNPKAQDIKIRHVINTKLNRMRIQTDWGK